MCIQLSYLLLCHPTSDGFLLSVSVLCDGRRERDCEVRETGKHGGAGRRQVKEMRREKWESKKGENVRGKRERKENSL